jgi:predicted SAM-dependent methyltransferase
LFGSNVGFLNKILYNVTGSSAYYSFEEFNDVIKNKKLYWCDLTSKIPLDDNSIDVVFTSHFLGHLTKNQGESLLNDIFRLMKPGGLVRILVPDLDIAIKRFSEGDINNTLGLFFYTSEECDFSAHKYNYTFGSLKDKLEKIGFKNIVRESHQNGECPDIKFLDVYPDHSLYVEARK